MSTAPDALAAPSIEALVGEMIATLALAANAYLEPKDVLNLTWTPQPWHATSPGSHSNALPPELKATSEPASPVCSHSSVCPLQSSEASLASLLSFFAGLGAGAKS